MKATACSKIRYIRQVNRGAGSARNLGVREATRDLLCFLDSDDEWIPGKVEAQRRVMAALPDVLFIFTDFVGVFGGQVHRRFLQSWHTDPRTWSEIMGPAQLYSQICPLPADFADFNVYTGNIYRGELHTNYVNTSTVMIRRVDAGEAIRFTENMKTFEDWECWGRLAQRGLAAYLDVETSIQHAHAGPRLTDADLLTQSECRLIVLKAVWGTDPQFLSHSASEYESVVEQQRANRVRALLGLGRIDDARAELDDLSAAPLSYRALAHMPAALVVRLVEAHRSVNRWREETATEKKKGRTTWA